MSDLATAAAAFVASLTAHEKEVIMSAANLLLTLLTPSAPPGAVNLTAPSINVAPVVNAAASASAGTWEDTPVLTYQWQSSDDGSTGWTDVVGMTALDSVYPASVYGTYLRLAEIPDGDAGAAAYSAVTATVTVPPVTFQVTTTGSNQSFSFTTTFTETVNVNWGDSQNNNYTAGLGLRSHLHASAGTYTVTIDKPLATTLFNITNSPVRVSTLTGVMLSHFRNLTSLSLVSITGAVLIWTVGADAPMPTGLTSLSMSSLSGLTWNVGANAPMPSGITSMNLNSLTGLTWDVGADAPMPSGMTGLALTSMLNVTWTVGVDAPMPSGVTQLSLSGMNGIEWDIASLPSGLGTLSLSSMDNVTWVVGADAPPPANAITLVLSDVDGVTWDVGSSAATDLPASVTSFTVFLCAGIDITDLSSAPALRTLRVENNLSQGAVDAILANLYAAFPARTANPTGGTIDLLGSGNAAPSGTLQAACPPTTGKEFAYELVNDSCGVSSLHWTSVTTA